MTACLCSSVLSSVHTWRWRLYAHGTRCHWGIYERQPELNSDGFCLPPDGVGIPHHSSASSRLLPLPSSANVGCWCRGLAGWCAGCGPGRDGRREYWVIEGWSAMDGSLCLRRGSGGAWVDSGPSSSEKHFSSSYTSISNHCIRIKQQQIRPERRLI